MFTMFMLSLQVFYEHYPWWLRWEKSAHNVGDLSSIPGLERSPGEGPGQYSGLESFMDCIVHGVTESRTRLSNLHFEKRYDVIVIDHLYTNFFKHMYQIRSYKNTQGKK